MVYVVIALSFALAGGIVGRTKGSSFFIWFLISGAVPIIGLAAAILYRYDTDEPRRAWILSGGASGGPWEGEPRSFPWQALRDTAREKRAREAETAMDR